MDSFIPRLHLNTARNPLGIGGGEAAATLHLNRTVAPLNTSGISVAGYSGTSSGSVNNTAMTSNTMNSDGNNNGGGYGGYTAGAAPPSPIPRFNGTSNTTRGGVGTDTTGFAAPSQGWPEHNVPRYTGPLESRSMPRPSTMRHLFASDSASSPRDTNVAAGDTGRLPRWGGASFSAPGIDVKPREDFLNRYRRSYGTDGFFAKPLSEAQSYDADRGSSTLFGGKRTNPNVFTSTYVGTSARDVPWNKSSYLRGGGGEDFDWPEGTRSLETGKKINMNSHTAAFRGESLPYDSDNPHGLVNSRSRARADRWTDEVSTDVDDEVTSLDAVAPPSNDFSSRRSRRRRGGGSGGGRRRHGNGDDDSEDSDDMWDVDKADSLSFADAVVTAMDSQPVVPLELLRQAQETAFVWIRHPSHGIVLLLLQHRGIYLPRYRELVDYHMSELFLHYLDLCREGAYFVYYASSKWPKERFFRIRMLPVNRLEAGTEPVPHLVITLHESGVHILDAIPLDGLVGVTMSPQAACFRPFLESPNTIIGCREGRGHRARLPVDGAFSLWFYDVPQHTSRSVDILTCDAKVFDIWTKTFRGLVSVNSSSVVQVALTPQGESAELAGLTQAAQEKSEIDYGERKGKFAEETGNSATRKKS